MEVHARLVRARQELAVVEEQLEVFLETADEARIRALVSETPLADRDWHDAQRHAAGYDARAATSPVLESPSSSVSRTTCSTNS